MVSKRNVATPAPQPKDKEPNGFDHFANPFSARDPVFQSETVVDHEEPQLNPEVITEPTMVKGRGRPRKTYKKASSLRGYGIGNMENNETNKNHTLDPTIEARVSNIEGSINSLAHMVKQGMGNIEAMVTKVQQQQQQQPHPTTRDARTHFQSVDPSLDINREDMKMNKYKDLYISSQKKNTELENEIVELRKKLEIAQAKIDGYERGQQVLSETFGNFKDAYLISCLTKTTDTMFGQKASIPEPSAKRSRKKVPTTPPTPAGENLVPPQPATRKNTRKVVEGEGSPAATRRKVSEHTEG